MTATTAIANPPKLRELRKQANRKRLIEATVDSIAQRGLADTTVARVVAGAGLSRGIVNLHFETKEALLVEALAYLAEEWRAVWEETLGAAPADPAARLEALLLAVFAPRVFTRRRLGAWHAFYADGKHQETYRRVCGDGDQAYLEALTGLCRQIIADGSYPGLDAQLTAKGLRAMTDGLCLDWLTDPQDMSRRELVAICRQALRSHFPRHYPMFDEEV